MTVEVIATPHTASQPKCAPEAQALLRKVAMRIEPAVNDTWKGGMPRPAIVTVKLKDGRSFSQRVDNPSGNAGNVDVEKVREKFRDCADTLGSAATIRKVEDAVMKLEKLAHVRELTQLIAGESFSTVGIRF